MVNGKRMDRRMEIIQKATCKIIPGTGYNRLGRPIKVNLRQYLQILYIFIDNPPLTCYNIGISVSVHIVWVLRLLGSKLLQATGCPDLLVLLGKADLLVHVQIKHVLGEQVHLHTRTFLMFVIQSICAAKCENHAIAMMPSIMMV